MNHGKYLLFHPILSKIVVAGNGATWDRFEPRAENQKNKIQKNLNFVF